MHVRSACDQWRLPGQCNACCVAVEFILGVLHHLMMSAHPILYVVFVFNLPRKWRVLSSSQCVDEAWF